MPSIRIRLLALIAGCLFAGAAHALAPSVQIAPAQPIAEPVSAGWALNFDILVRNDAAEAITLERIEVSMLDAAGAVLRRNELSGNGSAPAIETMPGRKLGPGERRMFFNPFPVVPQALGVRRVQVRLEFSTGDDNVVYNVEAEAPVSGRRATVVSMPLRGRVLNWDGHELLAHHRRWDYTLSFLAQLGFASNAMRYSYDFVPLDSAGRKHTGDGSRPADWVGFGREVRAAAAGTVVKVVANQPDDGSFNPPDSLKDPNALCGNYVVVDQGGVFALFAHLKQGSIKVATGDRVRRGQVLAAIGNSGSSLFPHLHFQLMDGADMRAEGTPVLFRDFSRRLGSARLAVRAGNVDSGEEIEAR